MQRFLSPLPLEFPLKNLQKFLQKLLQRFIQEIFLVFFQEFLERFLRKFHLEFRQNYLYELHQRFLQKLFQELMNPGFLTDYSENSFRESFRISRFQDSKNCCRNVAWDFILQKFLESLP